MSYRGSNKERFEYLLRWGTEPGLIDAFLKESKARLILAGAKADNLPRSRANQIEFVASLSDKAHKVIQEWFAAHLESAPDEPSDQIVFRFLQAEIGMRQQTDDEKKRDARMLLRLLVDNDCPEIVLSYLKTQIGSEQLGGNSESTQHSLDSLSPIDVTEVCAVVSENGEVPDVAKGAVAMLVGALVRAHAGDEPGARDFQRRLVELIPGLTEEVGGAISNALDRSKVEEQAPRGILVENPITVDSVSDIDPENVEVVGYCSNILDGGARFIEVVGLQEGEEFVQLTNEQARQLFPETGDLMEFPGPGNLPTADLRVLNIWRVQRHDVGKPTKFRVTKLVGPVYEVLSVPYGSTDPDKVREWFIHRHVGVPTIRPLFQLRDGIIVKAPTDAPDFARLDFGRPFDAWYSLVGVSWNRRVFVLGNLPPADLKWECPPVVGAIRKLLKTHVEFEQLPRLSKHDVQVLCRLAEEQRDAELTAARIERARNELSSLTDQRELVHGLIGDLLNVPRVQDEIDVAKGAVLAEFKASRAEAIAELEKLARQREAIIGEITQKKEDVKRQSTELVKSIRKAFDNAKAAGIDSLAQIALFQAVLSKKTPATQEAVSPTDHEPMSRLLVAKLASGKGNLSERFQEIGLTRTVSRRWAIAIENCAQAGYFVAFRGAFAQLIAQEVASLLSKRTVLSVSVPVGLIDGAELGRAVRDSENSDVILLKNANLSAMEAYSEAVCDAASRRVALGSSASGPIVVLSLVNGPASLPLPASIEAITLLLDLDMAEPESFDGEPADLVGFARDRLTQARVNGDVWLAGLQRLLLTLSNVDTVDNSAVLGLVKSGLIEPFLGSIENSTVERH